MILKTILISWDITVTSMDFIFHFNWISTYLQFMKFTSILGSKCMYTMQALSFWLPFTFSAPSFPPSLNNLPRFHSCYYYYFMVMPYNAYVHCGYLVAMYDIS